MILRNILQQGVNYIDIDCRTYAAGCAPTEVVGVADDIPRKGYKMIYITKVIFNNPATVIFWSDNTKTVVTCQKGDTYSKEMGLAMCICKKSLGNSSSFNNVFKKHIPEYGDNPVKSTLYLEEDHKVFRYKGGEWKKLTDDSATKVQERIFGEAKKKPRKKIDKEAIKRLYQQHMKPTEIAAELGIGRSSVYNVLKEFIEKGEL